MTKRRLRKINDARDALEKKLAQKVKQEINCNYEAITFSVAQEDAGAARTEACLTDGQPRTVALWSDAHWGIIA